MLIIPPSAETETLARANRQLRSTVEGIPPRNVSDSNRDAIIDAHPCCGQTADRAHRDWTDRLPLQNARAIGSWPKIVHQPAMLSKLESCNMHTVTLILRLSRLRRERTMLMQKAT
jgi:hypothetical protein